MFAGIPIALLLFGFAAQKEQDDIAEALFWLGSMSNLVLTFWLLTRTFIHPVSSSEVNPSMMIPLLGNLLAAYSTEQWLDKKGFMDLAFFLFTPSFILWLLLAPGILLRLTDAPALAPKVRITVFSYVAAPALSAACYLILVKEMDIVFLGLFFFSVFAELLMVALFLTNYFKAPFEEGRTTTHFNFSRSLSISFCLPVNRSVCDVRAMLLYLCAYRVYRLCCVVGMCVVCFLVSMHAHMGAKIASKL